MSDLKPCPFCGSSATYRVNQGREYATCSNQNCWMCIDVPTKFWNRRPIEDSLRARIAELEAMQKKAVEQSEYIQSHGLTEFEVAGLRAENERLKTVIRQLSLLCDGKHDYDILLVEEVRGEIGEIQA